MGSEREAFRVLAEAVSSMQATTVSDGTILKEALTQAMGMLQAEDRGWTKLNGAGDGDFQGLDVNDMKDWSKKIREAVVGAPWIKRGLGLRSSYIWKDGMRYASIPTEGRGRGTNVQKIIDHPLNQRDFFGAEARRRREGSLYHDGIALWIGADDSRLLTPVPINEISDTITDPDRDDIIWAYRRTWTRRSLTGGRGEEMVRWYFVDHSKDKQQATVTYDGKREKVETGYTAFDMHANRLEGWKFGAPDALAAWIWNSLARDGYMDGLKMTQALATFAFRASVATTQGGQNAALQFASPQGAGSTAVTGGANSLVPMSSAGRGYEFSTLREVVAVIATSLSLSSIDLTSNPGDAGSSYGSAQTLVMPVRLAMTERRDEHVELDRRVLSWMGAKEAKPYFLAFEDGAEMYRKAQAVVLGWQQGLYSAEEAKARLEAIYGNPVAGPIPDGLILPSNTAFPESPTNDATSGGVQQGAPDQGRASGAGTAKKAKDTRSDTIG